MPSPDVLVQVAAVVLAAACSVDAPIYTSIDAGDDAVVDANPDGAPDGDPVVPGSWAKQVPGEGFGSVDGIAVVSDGSVIVTGSFDGTLDLGGGPMAATGAYDAFIAKFTAAGEHVWSHRFGGDNAAGGSELAVLSDGDIVLAGMYRGTLTLGSDSFTAVGNRDVFVARLNEGGVPQWAVTGGGSADDTLNDLAVDASDRIAVCGGFTGTETFFGDPITGSNDPWLAMLAGNGSTTWAKAVTLGGIGKNCGVAIMGNGDAVVGSSFIGTTNLGGGTLMTEASHGDAVLARFLAATGAHVWSVKVGSNGSDEAINDIEASGGSIVATGIFNAETSLGGSELVASGGNDGFVAKFNGTNGSHEFSSRMGGPSSEVAQYVSVRADGGIAVSGLFSGTAEFGGTSLTSNGDIDPFVVEVDGASGDITSVKSVGGASRDEAHAVVTTGDSLVFAGSFGGSIVMLGDTYTAIGSALDGYVIRFKR